MFEQFIFDRINRVFEHSETLPLSPDSKFVVFSDLHMGSGNRADDFKHNSDLFIAALKEFYFKQEYGLILNGDVEELQKFRLEGIEKRWKHVYELFEQFQEGPGFYKIIGNHDDSLYAHLAVSHPHYKFPLLRGLKLKYKNDTIFLYHGDKASTHYENFSELGNFLLRYILMPLRIKNKTTAYDSKRKHHTEVRTYHYSVAKKIVSIIGHTHRPLFESLSKLDSIKFTVEKLCREYPRSDAARKKEIKEIIGHNKNLIKKLAEGRGDGESLLTTLYSNHIVVPCIFNSGCVIGKKGITGIEIDGNKIRLVQWFDSNVKKKPFDYSRYDHEQLGNSSFHRIVVKEDDLDYIFTRIHLLV